MSPGAGAHWRPHTTTGHGLACLEGLVSGTSQIYRIGICVLFNHDRHVYHVTLYDIQRVSVVYVKTMADKLQDDSA